MNERRAARELANQSLALGDATGWFEKLYDAAQGDESSIPWADMAANPNLTEWLEFHKVRGDGRSALVIGCGLGDDAEMLARLGFDVLAFDISPTAVQWCQQRFKQSDVKYVVGDLLTPPADWNRRFEFVLESYTLQVLPPDLRRQAMERMAQFVREDGELLVICRGRSTKDEVGQMPWPIVRSELEALVTFGLNEISFEDYSDREQPPVRRFRVRYRR